MAAREIKSYSLYGSKAFVDEAYDEATRQKIFAALSTEAQELLNRRKKAATVAPEYATEIWRAIVDVHKDDPARAVDQLRACGRYSGNYATNTYLKLLFKILSVKMFAEKLPEIWSRDCSFGKLNIDISQLKSGRLPTRDCKGGTSPPGQALRLRRAARLRAELASATQGCLYARPQIGRIRRGSTGNSAGSNRSDSSRRCRART